MLSPEITTGTLALLKLVVGSMKSPSPADLDASAVKGGLTAATTSNVVANKRNAADVAFGLFFFLILILRIISISEARILWIKEFFFHLLPLPLKVLEGI